MEIRADEISRIIREQISGHDTSTSVEETGTVLTEFVDHIDARFA